MNLKQIESFIILSNELHYGKAAERLGISQPSLSQQIKLLESSLGVTLFEKSGRNIKLTKAGHVFLQRSVKIQKEIDFTKKEMIYFQYGQRDNIRLGASGSHLIINPFQQFTDAFPDTILHVTENSTEKTIEKVKDKQLEIGIVYAHEKCYGLTVEPLFCDELLAVIPKKNDLSTKNSIFLNDLNNEPLILLEQKLLIRKFIDKQFKQKNIVPNIICELNNYHACLSFVEMQLGISLIAKSMLQNTNIPKSVIVKPISDLCFHKSIDLIYRTDLLIDEPIDYLLQQIRNMKNKL